MPTKKNFRLVLAATAIVLLLVTTLFLGAETLLRRTYGKGFNMRVDPYVEHAYRPYLDAVEPWPANDVVYRLRTNSLGFRDPEPAHEVEKRPSRPRLLFLGDSFTDGVGYDALDTFAFRTGRLLEARGLHVDILNGGVQSYAPLLEYIQLKRLLARGYHADVAVVFVDFSDVHDESYYRHRLLYDAQGEPTHFMGVPYHPLLSWLFNASVIPRAVRQAFWNLRDRVHRKPATQAASKAARPTETPRSAATRPLQAAEVARMDGEATNDVRWHWPLQRESLEGWVPEALGFLGEDILRLKRLADANHITLALAIYPWPNHLLASQDAATNRRAAALFPFLHAFKGVTPYEATVRRVCAANGIPLLDLFADFRQRGKRWPDLYRPPDMHFNDAGHALVAERVTRFLLTHERFREALARGR